MRPTFTVYSGNREPYTVEQPDSVEPEPDGLPELSRQVCSLGRGVVANSTQDDVLMALMGGVCAFAYSCDMEPQRVIDALSAFIQEEE